MQRRRLASPIFAAMALVWGVSGIALAKPPTADASKALGPISIAPQQATLMHGVSLEQGAEPTPVLLSVSSSKAPVLGYASLRQKGKVTIRLTSWGNVEVDGRVLDAKTHMEGLQLKCTAFLVKLDKCPASEVTMPKGATVAVIFYKPYPGFTLQ